VCTRILFIADGRNVADPATPAPLPGTAASRIQCEIGFLGSFDQMNRTLESFPGSRVLEGKDGLLLIELQGGPAEASSLLRAVLDAGIIVEHFDARGPDLEERYRRAFGERLS
jgi:hypothetical protein